MKKSKVIMIIVLIAVFFNICIADGYCSKVKCRDCGKIDYISDDDDDWICPRCGGEMDSDSIRSNYAEQLFSDPDWIVKPEIPPYEQLQKVAVTIDGQPLLYDTGSVILNGKTYVPAKAFAEALGAQMTFDDNWKRIIIKKEGLEILWQLFNLPVFVSYTNTWGNKTVSDSFYQDSPPVIINNRAMVPLRFISETLGASIKWDQYTSSIMVSKGTYVPQPVDDIQAIDTVAEYLELDPAKRGVFSVVNAEIPEDHIRPPGSVVVMGDWGISNDYYVVMGNSVVDYWFKNTR